MKKLFLLICTALMLSACVSSSSYAYTNCVKADCDIVAVHHHMY